MLLLLLLACGSSPTVPGPAEAAPPPLVAPAAPAARDPELIAAAPVPQTERLAPCAVLLTHTVYDPETRDPTASTHPATRLLRRWSEELRNADWQGVAPIPLSRAQALALLPSPTAYDTGTGVFATVADGQLSYAFDDQERTSTVSWDPTADSSDYVYAYSYDCPSGESPLPQDG